MEIYQSQKFRDMVALGTMLNAIKYAHENGVPYQLAKFGYCYNIAETICITEGLLYRALTLSEVLLERYGNETYVLEFEALLNEFRYYKPPEVLLEMQSNGPFRIGTKPKAAHLLRELCINGKNELFRPMETGQRGVPVAMVTDSDDVWNELKRGTIPETHVDMESVIDCLVDEFTLAAEEFIFGIAKELGLSTATEPPAEEMKLAA